MLWKQKLTVFPLSVPSLEAHILVGTCYYWLVEGPQRAVGSGIKLNPPSAERHHPEAQAWLTSLNSKP